MTAAVAPHQMGWKYHSSQAVASSKSPSRILGGTERLMERPISDNLINSGLFGQSNLMIPHLVLTGVRFLAVKGSG